MMYMHYCKTCHRVHMLNGHKLTCPKCGESIVELQIPYMDYVSLDMEQRESFKTECTDAEKLKHLSTTYRMYKYSKWYKDLQAQRMKESVFREDEHTGEAELAQHNSETVCQ